MDSLWWSGSKLCCGLLWPLFLCTRRNNIHPSSSSSFSFFYCETPCLKNRFFNGAIYHRACVNCSWPGTQAAVEEKNHNTQVFLIFFWCLASLLERLQGFGCRLPCQQTTEALEGVSERILWPLNSAQTVFINLQFMFMLSSLTTVVIWQINRSYSDNL